MKVIKKYNQFLESKSSDMWPIIPQSVKDLNDIFKKSGKKLYLVGGSVRDFLTGDKPKDFDLATDALPDEVIKILQSHNYSFNLQGKSFGVVVVYTEDQPMGMEIATFREDLSKGRNPEVKLGVTIEDDVKRRDLTYNALFYDLDKGEIIDLVGGVEDLKNKKTRMVGDPIERFNEDSLRILRAFRFASRYGHPLDKDTHRAILDRNQLENIDIESGQMKRISQERIWEEIKKAWSQAKDFNHYLEFFNTYNMWGEVFPGSKINTKFVDSDNFVIVMANLFIKEELTNLENRLVQEYKIEGDLSKKIVFLISFLNFKPEKVFEFYKKKKQSGIIDTHIKEWINVTLNGDDKWMNKFIEYKPIVSAEDLIKKGFKGASLGIEIKRLETEKFIKE